MGSRSDTTSRFWNYCDVFHVVYPFRHFFSNEEREDYLRLLHTFNLWDYHFWMPWEKFKLELALRKDYADVERYMPCDAGERQCSMECQYFGGKCPREAEDLCAPEMLRFDGRWEIKE